MSVKLNSEEARKDLTVREVAKLLGGTVGCLCSMADKETVQQAIDWWSENFNKSGAFEMTRQMEADLQKMRAKA